jgi:hypothetical protein
MLGQGSGPGGQRSQVEAKVEVEPSDGSCARGAEED